MDCGDGVGAGFDTVLQQGCGRFEMHPLTAAPRGGEDGGGGDAWEGRMGGGGGDAWEGRMGGGGGCLGGEDGGGGMLGRGGWGGGGCSTNFTLKLLQACWGEGNRLNSSGYLAAYL